MQAIRKIRSFVCRTKSLTGTQNAILDNYWETFGLEIEAGGLLDFNKIFGRSAPVVLEIGFGDGRSLLEMAKSAPDKNFMGVEVYRRGIATLLMGILEKGLCNLRMMRQDVQEVIPMIPDASLDTVQIFFADPWPKLRHHKRRLIQSEFVKDLERKLKPNGILHLATDWQDYAHHMMSVISQNNSFQNLAGKNQFSERPTYRPVTKYERRAKDEGRESVDLIFQRIKK